MGALSSVNLLGNYIGYKQAQALASILKEHPTLKSLCGNKGDETELDMSGKGLGASGAIMLAPEITDNGTLSKLIFGGDCYLGEKDGERIFPEPAMLKMGMTEADFSNKNLGAGGAIIIAAWLTHKDKGALFSRNLSRHNIDAYGVASLTAALKRPWGLMIIAKRSNLLLRRLRPGPELMAAIYVRHNVP
jgi:hypothetical protein